MQEEIDYRRGVLAPKLGAELQRAREFGDLSENAEYKEAKRDKRRNDARIRYLENMIRTANVIEAEESDGAVALFDKVTKLMRDGVAVAAYTPTLGGVAEAVMKMSFGNGLGFRYADGLTEEDIFGYAYGAFLLEVNADVADAIVIGEITNDGAISRGAEKLDLNALLGIYEDKLESVYSCNIPDSKAPMETFSYQAEKRVAPAIKVAKPTVLIPAFPGTNCE